MPLLATVGTIACRGADDRWSDLRRARMAESKSQSNLLLAVEALEPMLVDCHWDLALRLEDICYTIQSRELETDARWHFREALELMQWIVSDLALEDHEVSAFDPELRQPLARLCQCLRLRSRALNHLRDTEARIYQICQVA